MSVDSITQRWMRGVADERAVENGCRFDVTRGVYAVWWIERFCRLYEGKHAGEPLILRGCAECQRNWEVPDTFDFDSVPEVLLERAESHADCYAAGHVLDWQYDVFMRLFSWVRWSNQWQREVRRFRQGSIWVAKKNKKSPSLSALGLYLTCGDGEPGQKVFFAAKDGKQAKENVGKHVLEMLRQSDELSCECTVNINATCITHEPTRSILQPLSSSNARTQESKEGLNGSVLIDETHVVDRAFIDRISRAGISREEPLQVEFSTAGNNPNGYGFERFKDAQAVESGLVTDEELLVAIYAAPQNLSDRDLAADPLKYGRMANPAMGHTVDPEEFLRDYERSTHTLDKLAKFKMYRLNIWQRAANPWLSQQVWAGARATYTEQDLVGLPCWGGLDLSLTRDMSALALAFRCEEIIRLLLWFWLPESFADENSDKASYREWEAAGALRLIPGDTIDHVFLRPELLEIIQKFKPKEIAFDKTFAEQLTADLERQSNFVRVQFPQTPLHFTSPCGDFERLLIEKKLQHNGHPVLTWQAGHVCLDRNARTNLVRPVKPKTGGEHLTVDGVQAAVMAISRAMSAPKRRDYYENNPLEFG